MKRTSPPIDGGVIVVTGASSGIGRAMARQLAPRARVLVLIARREERLEKLAWELVSAHPALVAQVEPCDLRDPTAARGVVAEIERDHGAIDVLVHDAGVGDAMLLEAAWWERIESSVRLNALGTIALVHAVLPGMVQRGRGGILAISSSFGLVPMPGLAAYSATKHFVTGLCDALRVEVRGKGVTITQSCPGPVESEFGGRAAHPGTPRVPPALAISAERCARESIAAFEAGRALVIPATLPMRAAITIGSLLPHGANRALTAPLAAWQRRRYEAAAQGNATADLEPLARRTKDHRPSPA